MTHNDTVADTAAPTEVKPASLDDPEDRAKGNESSRGRAEAMGRIAATRMTTLALAHSFSSVSHLGRTIGEPKLERKLRYARDRARLPAQEIIEAIVQELGEDKRFAVLEALYRDAGKPSMLRNQIVHDPLMHELDGLTPQQRAALFDFIVGFRNQEAATIVEVKRYTTTRQDDDTDRTTESGRKRGPHKV